MVPTKKKSGPYSPDVIYFVNKSLLLECKILIIYYNDSSSSYKPCYVVEGVEDAILRNRDFNGYYIRFIIEIEKFVRMCFINSVQGIYYQFANFELNSKELKE